MQLPLQISLDRQTVSSEQRGGASWGAVLTAESCVLQVPTPRYQHAAVTSQHSSVQLCAREERKSSYHVCITFRHITFGRTPGVLAILTRPLHTQRAKHTEGVNQSSCREIEESGGLRHTLPRGLGSPRLNQPHKQL